ncbi:iron-sulfur cluster-binding flavoprotein [Geotalea daltonii FRC-32]|uniref:Iron-sulfur cluster-binding flavoprotein n=1 Tax=Geotalea daltonii (strain DSM 22248 / JCM 15807 / FRC-32) TaxID=316067 RepID=B9M8T0_GEODF|nr:flavodoxin family protein [Geotalea daltonii]ACM20426.1 iron-sulfur cluster-binding flavoprotein [Geotalea daltonii FRC-32]
MKIVCLLGSPRSNGNSAAIAQRFLEKAGSLGAETRIFELNRLSYRGCQACYACKSTADHCVLDDDLSQVLEGVKDADVVVYASPVYYGDITAQLKGFMDRTFSYLVPDYETNPQPTRLQPGKNLLFILTQGDPDPEHFADIFPRYEYFLKWGGFAQIRLIRACGLGGEGAADVSESTLQEAADAAAAIMA